MSGGDPFAEGDMGPLTEAQAPAGIGHNKPPAGAEREGLQARITRENAELLELTAKLEAEAGTMPRDIDASTEGKVTDLVSLMKGTAKTLEGRRETTKEPYLSATRIVDAFFGGPRDRLKTKAADLERRLGTWLQVKAANERRAREEREAQEREEARRRFDEAVRAQEAETAAATALAAAQQATANAALDLGEARKAIERATNEYVAARNDHAAAVARMDAPAVQEALNRMVIAEAAGKAARVRATELADAAAAADARERQAQQEANARSRAAAETLDAAAAAETSAAKLGREAAAPVKDLSRTRGDYGMSGLRKDWTFDDFDRAKLDLEALREHLPAAGIETAIRSYIKAGGRNLRGVSIYQDTRAVVR